MDRRRLVALAGGSALLIVMGAGTALAADRSVAISGFTFSPRTVTVNVGDTVTWTNSDAQAHTATSGSAWSTGDIGNGESASITFSTAGMYDYICAIHPTMTGTVVVSAGGAPPTDTLPASGRDAGGPQPTTLALLGLVTLVAAVVAGRRLRDRAAA